MRRQHDFQELLDQLAAAHGRELESLRRECAAQTRLLEEENERLRRKMESLLARPCDGAAEQPAAPAPVAEVGRMAVPPLPIKPIKEEGLIACIEEDDAELQSVTAATSADLQGIQEEIEEDQASSAAGHLRTLRLLRERSEGGCSLEEVETGSLSSRRNYRIRGGGGRPLTAAQLQEVMRTAEDVLDDLPPAQKALDPLRSALVLRKEDGIDRIGVVEDVKVARVSNQRLYRVKYTDGDLEHMTENEVRELRMRYPKFH